jgi:hypothetical protein
VIIQLGKRSGTIDYVIVGYVKGTETNLDTKRNQFIEVVSKKHLMLIEQEVETH